MLTVSLHAGPLASAAFNNRLGWMEIAYAARPAPLSNYKAVVSTSHEGASPQLMVERYPRFAGSLWDLVARVLAAYLRPADAKPQECLWPVQPSKKFIPYVTAISAVIEALPSVKGQRARELATCEVRRRCGARGRYEATFTEDCLGEHTVNSFLFRPERMKHWELLQHALVHRLSDDGTLPARPFIFAPDGVKKDGKTFVALEHLAEPARTCFARWLVRHGHQAEFDSGLAGEQHYLDFLQDLA